MHTEKISISLPGQLSHFIDEYQHAHAYKSRSEVIKEALKLLRQKELEKHYLDAEKESDTDFDITAADGIDDEAW